METDNELKAAVITCSLILQSDALKQLQHILHSLPKEIAAIILFQEGSKKEGRKCFI